MVISPAMAAEPESFDLVVYGGTAGGVITAVSASREGLRVVLLEPRDHCNFPNQLYIREARRMVGDFVVTQKDLQTELTKTDPIGMGSYNSDSHNIQRVIGPNGMVVNEGDVQVAVKPYQIPYRVMLPKRTELANLLVPVCFSASHVAYSSLRMEPQYMIIGQAAGVAAAMAVKSSKPVQEIDIPALVARLREQGALMEQDVTNQLQVIAGFARRARR